ncbi:MAG: triose-phosphate isomerase [Chlamydiia bacterium]|nr:triose-phosphate isomerase [Chlamydiia bacterium]
MTFASRPVVIAGNWKMHKTAKEAVDFVNALAPKVAQSQASVFLAVPFTTIHPVVEALNGNSHITVGAQNMNDADEGAFTGEIAGKMLLEAGAKFVVLGHSERRHIFGETSAFINKKVKRALADGLKPIVCFGETLEEREAGNTHEVLKEQISVTLEGLTPDQVAQIIIAYEPVWAIGTGKTATPLEAQDAHDFCRRFIGAKWGDEIASQIVIQYGGSVKPDNAKSLMVQTDIDGLLVGGASLDVDTFSKIVNYQNM